MRDFRPLLVDQHQQRQSSLHRAAAAEAVEVEDGSVHSAAAQLHRLLRVVLVLLTAASLLASALLALEQRNGQAESQLAAHTPSVEQVEDSGQQKQQRQQQKQRMEVVQWQQPVLPTQSIVLSDGESEAAWLLTGTRSAASALSQRTSWPLRVALGQLAKTLLFVRPALQRDLWLSHCQSHLPCAYPNLAVLLNFTEADNRDPDGDVIDGLCSSKTQLVGLNESMPAPPNVDLLFHAAGAQRSHFAPGETASDQQLAQDFQSMVHNTQHPPNCNATELRFLLQSVFNFKSGFGTYTQSRAAIMAAGIRATRTVMELPGFGDYLHAFSDCMRRQGMGGCELFLPATSCPLPADWMELFQADKAAWLAAPQHVDGNWSTYAEHIGKTRDRRWFYHWDWFAEVENNECCSSTQHNTAQHC